MTHQTAIRVKICCIANMQEARMAISYGASAIGLVSAMPSGPGPIPEDLIVKIVATIPPGVSTFLLTSRQDAAGIVEQHRRTRTTTIQIVDELSHDQYAILRKELPGIKLVQVIHVLDKASVQEAVDVSSFVDAILLDSGNPNLATKVLGGTGKTHDWTISRKIRESVHIPLYLAGGLTSANVRQAIEAVQPFAVDVCSGVRTNGSLDEEKLAAFFEAVGDTKARL